MVQISSVGFLPLSIWTRYFRLGHAAELQMKGIAFSFAELKSGLRETMRRTGLEEQIGSDHYCDSIEECVQAFLERQQRGGG
jgi:hypothetical protein